ncbi:hypothetical protein ABL78_7114 [Leptomonas seymouri]|uniref:Uncharacterized protein n=1 Tax=Leptomonas seymouri TaxID=5684 RepID=A0A0N1PAG5_LEPSE|nr:hypothetical protein ABL78_7114 [Leptomonas seymouri]|eukprot:KPI83848.1 hypothetical protein ABL78_7114 [Leptomonas seymouri]
MANAETSVEALREALTVLQQATALDFSGDLENAVEAYTAAVTHFDAVVEVLPPDLAETVRRNTEEVRRKIDMLRRSRWTREQSSLFPSFTIQFVPTTTPVEDYRVPHSAFSRVFWLMRLLKRSIQQGAFLTPSLYVSRDVWLQDGGRASLRFISAKTKYMSALCSAMEPLRSMTTLGDISKTERSLRRFVDEERELRSSLDNDIGLVKDVKPQKKSVWGALAKKAKSWTHQESSYDLCLTWAVNALEQGQLFERWYVYFAQAARGVSPVPSGIEVTLDLLQHIGVQLYTGLCVFLLHDMTVLVERYQVKCMKSVTRLLPAEPKLEGGNGS